MEHCKKCKSAIDPTEIYGDWFYCKTCHKEWTYQPERLKRSDAEMQSESPNLAVMQGDTQK